MSDVLVGEAHRVCSKHLEMQERQLAMMPKSSKEKFPDSVMFNEEDDFDKHNVQKY